MRAINTHVKHVKGMDNDGVLPPGVYKTRVVDVAPDNPNDPDSDVVVTLEVVGEEVK